MESNEPAGHHQHRRAHQPTTSARTRRRDGVARVDDEPRPVSPPVQTRSDDAGQAHAHILAAAHANAVTLTLQQRRDVGPATSNQWLLIYTVGP